MKGSIPFAEWTPDRPDRKSGATEALGVVSQSGDYSPLKSLIPYSSAGAVLDGPAAGYASFYDSNGVVHAFMGDATKLYKNINQVITDVSKVGGYALTSETHWVFEQFGNYIIAAASNTNMQVFELNVSTGFTDLAGAPQADTVGRLGDFLFAGIGNKVIWSAYNNILDWTPDVGTQSGEQVFPEDGGNVQAIIGTSAGVIFHERSIRRATYIGAPLLFDFGQEPLEKRRGAVSKQAVAQWGRDIFYASEDGFYVFDGAQSIDIGAGKVNDYYTSKINYPNRNLVTVAVDPTTKTVMFGIPTGPNPYITEILYYSLTDGRWTHDNINVELIGTTLKEGYTVDTIHNWFGHTNLDGAQTDVMSIDSSLFKAGRAQPMAFDTSHELKLFNGLNRPATIDTQEFEAQPGMRSLVTSLWPLVDAEKQFVSAGIGSRPQRPGQSVVYSNLTAMNDVGFCQQFIDGRFLRARLQIGANAPWSHAEGFEYDGVLSGAR